MFGEIASCMNCCRLECIINIKRVSDAASFKIWRIMNSFEEGFAGFVSKYSGAEVVFDVLKPSERSFPNADYFFNNRRVVAELKCLEEEKYMDIHNIFQRLLNKGEIRPFQKGMTIGEVLRGHPREESIRDEIYNKITSSLAGALEKANRQIRETKRHFNLVDSRGIAILVNLDNTILEPLIADRMITKILLQKNGAGLRYEELNLVIYISEVHFFEEGPGRRAMPFFVATRKKDLDEVDTICVNDFMKMWSEFRGLPIAPLETASREDIKGLPFGCKEKDFDALCKNKLR